VDFVTTWTVADVRRYWDTDDVLGLVHTKIKACRLLTEDGNTLTTGDQLTEVALSVIASDVLLWLADWIAEFVMALEYPGLQHGEA
jgi:hypothetical protein